MAYMHTYKMVEYCDAKVRTSGRGRFSTKTIGFLLLSLNSIQAQQAIEVLHTHIVILGLNQVMFIYITWWIIYALIILIVF